MQCSPPFFPLYIVHVSEDVVTAAQSAVYFFHLFFLDSFSGVSPAVASVSVSFGSPYRPF